ncbi:GNAT family N-acetyltransferase [Bacillus nitroreducens]
MEITIRQEIPKDYHVTEEVIRKAFLNEEFSDKKEHYLVKRIRKSNAFIPELSLVAVNQKEDIVGNILLSKIQIVDGDQSVESLALAPVSVIAEYQRLGIGSQLIEAALERAKELGYQSVIVLGHKDYYPRFGFKQANLWNIRAPFDVPNEVFMAIELFEGSLKNVQGIVKYSEAFNE